MPGIRPSSGVMVDSTKESAMAKREQQAGKRHLAGLLIAHEMPHFVELLL